MLNLSLVVKLKLIYNNEAKIIVSLRMYSDFVILETLSSQLIIYWLNFAISEIIYKKINKNLDNYLTNS